jgi:MFS family permease
MLPLVAGSLHTTSTQVAVSLTAYFVPFAVLQLVSGTLGERWGRRRTVRVAYLVYAAASVACAFAPSLLPFLVARAAQGAANAFTSPLLLAGLAEMVRGHRLGRAVGRYSSGQAAGQSFAPLVGGLAAVASWRLAFGVVAVTALLLSLAPPPGEPRPGAGAPRWRGLANRRVGLLSLAALLSYLGAAGLPFLVSLYASEHLHLAPDATGLVLVGFGVAGLLLGSVWGVVSERLGPIRCALAAAVATALFVAPVGFTGSVAALAVCWTLAGAAASLFTVALQTLAVGAVPGNTGGALSVVSAFRFGGGAIAPLVLLPLYGTHVWPAFVAAAGAAVLAGPAVALLGRRRAADPRPAPKPAAAPCPNEG